MKKYFKYSDYKFARIRLKCIRQVNEKKEYNDEALTCEERMQVISLLCKRLDINEMQATHLLDHFVDERGWANILAKMEMTNLPKSYPAFAMVKRRLYIALGVVIFGVLLFTAFASIITTKYLSGEETQLPLIVLMDAFALIIWIFAILGYFENRFALKLKLSTQQSCLTRQIKAYVKKIVTVSNEITYKSDVMDIDYAKFYLDCNGQEGVYILPLATKSITIRGLSGRKLGKILTEKYSGRSYLFDIEENYFITDIQPDMMKCIQKEAEKLYQTKHW